MGRGNATPNRLIPAQHRVPAWFVVNMQKPGLNHPGRFPKTFLQPIFNVVDGCFTATADTRWASGSVQPIVPAVA